MDRELMEQAQCFGHSDPDAWFPESSKHLDERQLIIRRGVEALSVCSYCPIQRKCLDVGLLNANINDGIFGGTLPYERKEAIGWRAHKNHDQERKIRRLATKLGVPVVIIVAEKRPIRRTPSYGSRKLLNIVQ